MERIPVTHAGSLIRPPELLSFLSAIDHGRAYESAAYQAALGKAVTDVVRKQVETGVDIVDDGEMGKPNWITYLYERTSGLESRPIAETRPPSCRRAGTGSTSLAPTRTSTPSTPPRQERATAPRPVATRLLAAEEPSWPGCAPVR